MDELTLYLWLEPFAAAIRETDDSVLIARVYAALSAIEKRWLTPVTDPDEEQALANAFSGLQTLITKRLQET
jgi:hypothetical protein